MAKHRKEHPHSSSISCCEYDDETKEMHITFASGERHCFKGVPKEEYDGLNAADSKGKHFHLHIRKRYESVKVD